MCTEGGIFRSHLRLTCHTSCMIHRVVLAATAILLHKLLYELTIVRLERATKCAIRLPTAVVHLLTLALARSSRQSSIPSLDLLLKPLGLSARENVVLSRA